VETILCVITIMISVVLFIAVACLVGTVATAWFILLRFLKWYFSPLHDLPGPKNLSFWTGCFPELIREEFGKPQLKWWKEAGYHVNMLHSTQIMGRSSLLILDKDIVKTILSAPSGKKSSQLTRFPKHGLDILRVPFGDGMVTLAGDDWTRHRRIIQPAFNTQFVRNALSTSIPPKVHRMIEYWKTACASDASGNKMAQEIDITSHLSAVMLDILGDVAFGHDFHGMDAMASWAKSNKNNSTTAVDGDSAQVPMLTDKFIQAMMQLLAPNLCTILLCQLGLSDLDLYINPRVIRNRKMLDHAADEIIAKARQRIHQQQQQQECNNGTDSSKEYKKTVLDIMLTAPPDPAQDATTSTKLAQQQQTLNDVEIQNEVKTLLIAGHETTATWCKWIFFCIAMYPDIQEKVYQDICKHLPKQQQEAKEEKHGEEQQLPPTTFGLGDIETMDYFNAFLQEVIRLYPPPAYIARLNNYEEVLGGVRIPAKTPLDICPFILHRHPKYWDEPLSFKPERWINVPEAEVERRRFAFVPFSAGGRNCIGQRFATAEAQLVIVHLLHAFRIQVAPSQRETDFEINDHVTVTPKPPLRIVVQARR
jgi:cytochrome P450